MRLLPATISVLTLFGSGCFGTALTPFVARPQVAAQRTDAIVEVVIPAELQAQRDSWGRFWVLGIVNEWECRTGEAYAPAFEAAARAVFRDVRRVEAPGQAQDATVTLIPRLLTLGPPTGSSFRVRFLLRATVQDRLGGVLLDKTYVGEDQGSQAAAFWGGAFVAEEVLARPTGRAMAKTLQQLARDLQELPLHGTPLQL